MRKFLPLFIIIALFFPFIVSASSETTSDGGTILEPAYFELSMAPEQAVTLDISITNKENTQLTYTVSEGELSKYKTDTGEYNYLLSTDVKDKVLSFAKTSYTIGAKDSVGFPVTIEIPKDTDKGSIYPVVIVSTENESGESSNSLKRQITSTFLINIVATKGEEAISQIKPEFSVVNKFVFTPQNIFNIKINNTGDTYVKPFGNIAIIDDENVKLTDIPVNQELKILLPDQSLSKEFKWDKSEGFKIIPSFGKYKALFGVSYGDQKTFLEQDFYVIPIFHIVALLALLIAIIALIVTLVRKLSRHKSRSKKDNQA
jgi:hypothetical protein